MKTSKRRVTVTWGFVVLGALSTAAFACGSPNWQNQYTETPYFTGAAEAADGSSPAEDGGGSPCPGAATCNSTLSATAAPSASIPPPGDPGNPLGNPDPVPWLHPVVMEHTHQ